MMKETEQGDHNTRRWPIEWMRWIPATLVGLLGLGLILISARVVLLPMLASMALAYLLAPIVKWLERRGWASVTAVIMTLSSAAIALLLSLIFVIPGIWSQVSKSYQQAQILIADRPRVELALEKVRVASPVLYDYLKTQADRLNDPAEQQRLRTMAIAWMQSGIFRLVDLTASILDLLLIPFFIFYFLADGKAMRERFDRLVPARFRAITEDLLHQINHVLSTYVRSQLLIALAMGVLYSLGFVALRVPLALTLGMLSGLLNFIPYLGTLTGLGLSLSFVALDGAGPGRIAGVLIVFAVVQSIEGYFLTPKLLGSSLNLHPLWVLVGLMIGGNLFGLLGIILAIPVIAVGKVLLGFLETLYRQSEFYQHAGHGLITAEGAPIKLTPHQPESTIVVEESTPSPPRRTVITTGELRIRNIHKD